MEDFADWNLIEGKFAGFESRWNNKTWQSYMIVGGAPTDH